MTLLYTPEEVRRLRKNARRARGLAALLGAAALAGCVALCFGLRTENMLRRQTAAIFLSTLGSFAAVLLLGEGALPAGREADHEEGVLKEEAEVRTGRIGQIAPAFRIPKSIAFHTVTLETEEGPVSLKLNARHRKIFPEAGTRIRTETRRDYVTAWEVIP